MIQTARHIARRILFVTCVTIAAAMFFETPALAQSQRSIADHDIRNALQLEDFLVETHISIRWADEKPVIGAKVIDHHTNVLLGLTDGAGSLLLTVRNGTVLRMVDPAYGQQQALHFVQGRKKSPREMMATTGTSAYVTHVAPWWEHL